MNRLDQTFARLRATGELGLLPYLTVGYPDPTSCASLLDAIAEADADGIELGVPFSDPLADGVTIQRAGERALANGVRLPFCLETVVALRARGVGFCTIIFPYEMQISSEAARAYKRYGINWEAAFEQGLTQRTLLSYLDGSFTTLNALDAFRETPARSAAVGQYFVYNLGDKLDWNHPNRAGHRVIADYVAREAAGCVKP